MKKLRLDVDRLRIESFPTGPAAETRGTVRANDATPTCTGQTYDDTLCGVSQACTRIPGLC
ncbi:hypothetical protein [Longimicrobium sp.]|uniref:hypothetical protein n=1 Tax=Longimicrobium sp. TaxID=2029185 RepID=UPI003B3B8039